MGDDTKHIFEEIARESLRASIRHHRDEARTQGMFSVIEAAELLAGGHIKRAGLMMCSALLFFEASDGVLGESGRARIKAIARRLNEMIHGGEEVVSPSTYRGHRIYYDEYTDYFRYCDTGQRTDLIERPCGCCGKEPTPEGHDGCLGELDGVVNACCGHGEPGQAYVIFEDGRELREQDAVDYFEEVQDG